MIPNIDYEATVFFRSLGNEELAAQKDSLSYESADLVGCYGQASASVAARLIEPRLKAAEAEIARRARLHAAGAGVPDPGAVHYETWRALAREVREQADIVAVFDRGGYSLRQTGRNEWHGPCFVCGGGVDRLLVRTDPPGRYWCRQCGLTGDSITATRTLHGLSFFDAVRQLATESGLAAPAVEHARATPNSSVRRLRTREVPRA
jgi:hypothetical protein